MLPVDPLLALAVAWILLAPLGDHLGRYLPRRRQGGAA